jgi:hypothetical protein
MPGYPSIPQIKDSNKRGGFFCLISTGLCDRRTLTCTGDFFRADIPDQVFSINRFNILDIG